MDWFHKEEGMKCVICKGDDIVVKTVDEQIAVEKDILLVRLDLPVCSQCGERYYGFIRIMSTSGYEGGRGEA